MAEVRGTGTVGAGGFVKPSGCYVALGDSMSIDLYPRLELDAAGLLPHDHPGGVGAASLLHQNDDDLWPEFAGRDLVSRDPDLEKVDRCTDGATILYVTQFQLPGVPVRTRETTSLVTLTAGGNDLLGAVIEGGDLAAEVERASTRFEALVEELLTSFPEAAILLATVYDPTDGSGHLPGLSETAGYLPIEQLEVFNDVVRRIASEEDRLRLADVHGHFIGHGVSRPPGEWWYWQTSPIEPGARGASEIRRLWLSALEE